jgi:hypothetical protein
MARLDGSLTMIFADHPAEHGKNALTNRIICASCRSICHFWALGLFLQERRPGNQSSRRRNMPCGQGKRETARKMQMWNVCSILAGNLCIRS